MGLDTTLLGGGPKTEHNIPTKFLKHRFMPNYVHWKNCFLIDLSITGLMHLQQSVH